MDSDSEEIKLDPPVHDPDILESGPAGYVGEIVKYEARGAIVELWDCEADEVVLSGPAGTGKSRGALERLHYLLMNTPKMRALICRKTMVDLTATGLVTFKNHVIHRLDGAYFYGGSKDKAAAFKYPNGAEAEVTGLDQASRKMSGDYDFIFVQEANEITEGEYEYLTTRLRNGALRFADGRPYQQIVIDVNPQEPSHWINLRAKRGDLVMLKSWHEDNPRLYNFDGTMTEEGRSYMRKLDKLSGVRYQRLRLGKWVAAEGQVYEGWSDKIHIIPPFKIPQDWARIRSIDFGYRNPFTCQWWSVDKEGRMYLYRELYRTERTVFEHAKRIKQLTGGQYIGATVADHDSEDRATLHENGIWTIRAKKAILPGIEAVKNRLEDAEDGKPRLFIFSNALVDKQFELVEAGKPASLAEEMTSYAWAPETQGKLPKEVPIDDNNHGCDAMRYAVMYLEKRYRVVGPGGVKTEKSKWVNPHGRG